MYFSEMQKKIKQIFFGFEIIAFELVVLNTRFYREREYLSSCVNMLAHGLKFSDTSKTKFFELISFQNDENI